MLFPALRNFDHLNPDQFNWSCRFQFELRTTWQICRMLIDTFYRSLDYGNFSAVSERKFDDLGSSQLLSHKLWVTTCRTWKKRKFPKKRVNFLYECLILEFHLQQSNSRLAFVRDEGRQRVRLGTLRRVASVFWRLPRKSNIFPEHFWCLKMRLFWILKFRTFQLPKFEKSSNPTTLNPESRTSTFGSSNGLIWWQEATRLRITGRGFLPCPVRD